MEEDKETINKCIMQISSITAGFLGLLRSIGVSYVTSRLCLNVELQKGVLNL